MNKTLFLGLAGLMAGAAMAGGGMALVDDRDLLEPRYQPSDETRAKWREEDERREAEQRARAVRYGGYDRAHALAAEQKRNRKQAKRLALLNRA